MQITQIYNNVNYRKPTLNKKNTQIFKGKKEDFGKMLIEDVFSKDISTISPDTEKNIINQFRRALSEILQFDNIIGKGFHGIIYKIDNNFVVKDIDEIFQNKNLLKNRVVKRNNQFKDLETYYGEEILNIEGYKILKNLGKHICAGVPKHIKENEIDLYYQTKHLPLFANVPQKSYDAIVKDFSTLNKLKSPENLYYQFDSYNPTNIVLSGNELKLVDEINETEIKSPNTVAKLCELLLVRPQYDKQVKDYGNNVNDARKILHKIILASEKVFLPYTEINPADKEFLDFAFEKCQSSLSFDEFLTQLVTMRSHNPIMPLRINELSDLLNKIMPIK